MHRDTKDILGMSQRLQVCGVHVEHCLGSVGLHLFVERTQLHRGDGISLNTSGTID